MENNVEYKKRQMPFEVPEGYFEGFEEKMMARFAEMEKEQCAAPVEMPKKNVRSITLRWMASGVAAAIVIVVGVMAILNMMNDVNKTGEEIVVAANQNSNDEYYDALNEELNSEEIEEALAQINYENGMIDE